MVAESSRLLVEVKDPGKVAEKDLRDNAPRGAVRTAPTRWQILAGPETAGIGGTIWRLTARHGQPISAAVLKGIRHAGHSA